MKPKLLGVLAMTATFASWFPTQSFAQQAPLPPPRTHSGPTMMGAKAASLQTQVAREIDQAKAGGTDVTAAQKKKDQGDAALKIGHYRIAVEQYEAAQKAPPSK